MMQMLCGSAPQRQWMSNSPLGSTHAPAHATQPTGACYWMASHG